jgi:hypothetical protein
MKGADDIYRVPAIVLFCIGAYDLVRGFMHTFLLKWSAVHFAGFDLATVPQDQVFMLGAFGISNFLTGALLLLISLRARLRRLPNGEWMISCMPPDSSKKRSITSRRWVGRPPRAARARAR